jgi:glycerol kinase
MLPEIKSSSEVFGHVAASLRGASIGSRRDPSTWGELDGVPIAGIAGDQQAALFGQACFAPAMAKNTYGTGCFMLMNSGTKPVDSKNKLLTTVAWQQGGPLEYAIEGGVFVGGAVVSWLRDGLGIIKSSADVEKLASSVPDSGGVVLVPAFVGLGAPHWDPYARGTIVGITRGTTAAHIARAGVESVALQVADLADAMGRDAGRPLSELRVDGGASVNNALLQYQSDVMQLPIVRPKVTETTAIGAAYLAGLATGVWKGRDEIAQHWQVDRRCEPKMSADQAASIRARWANAVERSRGWAKH